MEPVGPSPGGGMLPPPVLARSITAEMPVTRMPVTQLPVTQLPVTEMPVTWPQFPQPPSSTHPGHLPRTIAPVAMQSMALWRYLGAGSAVAVVLAGGAQVQRVIDGSTRSTLLLAAGAVAWISTMTMVLIWTYAVTENARRLVAPAQSTDPPDPRKAVATWALPMTLLTVAGIVTIVLSWQINTPDEPPSSVPLAIAVLSILLVVPLAAPPFNYLARVVRQVGGHSTELLKWLWVPVALGVVGVATIAGLRAGGAIEDTDQLAPMWVVAVVAIAPCVIVILLGWRAAESVEEAVTVAADRRLGMSIGAGASRTPPIARRTARLSVDLRNEAKQVPGSDALRFAIVLSVAGLALLGVVGAAVMFLFWFDTRNGVILPSQRDRAWDMLDVLGAAAVVVGCVVGVLMAAWSFVAVLNVRFASGRRCNPLISALSWPVAAVVVWLLADRLTLEPSLAETILILLAQAAALYIPFLLIDRAADAVDARRTPVRITYCFALVLLVYTEALVTLTDVTDTVTNFDFGRLAGFLALGSVVLLLSTLAITEMCRTVMTASSYEVDHHNALVAQRRDIEARAVPAEQVAAR